MSLNDVIAQRAKENGINVKLAQDIAFCESTSRQFNRDGSVLRGRVNPSDSGIFQINKRFHLETSRQLGFDIETTEGNIGYAMWLLKHEGSYHWNASKSCWGGA